MSNFTHNLVVVGGPVMIEHITQGTREIVSFYAGPLVGVVVALAVCAFSFHLYFECVAEE